MTLKDTYDWFVAPTDEDQTFFDTWDFVSMHTLKIELGIDSEMDVHDRTFKVKPIILAVLGDGSFAMTLYSRGASTQLRGGKYYRTLHFVCRSIFRS